MNRSGTKHPLKPVSRALLVPALVLAVGLLIVPRSLAAAPPGPGRPNVLILHVDQLRFDCLGACGNRDVKTPNLDRLAADGVRYVNSFCEFPVCTPSRYTLISGRPTFEHRGWDNRSTLAPTFNTFPKILRAAGYRTKAVGKMHYTPTYLDVGFDEMVLAEQDGPGRWDDDYHRYLMRLDLVDRNDLEDQRAEYRSHARREYWDTMGALVSNLPEEHHSTTWIGDRAAESIRSWDSRRSHLLMVGFIKPHHPFDPPAPWHTMYDPEKLALLPGWTNEVFPHDFQFARGYFPYDRLSEAGLHRVMAYYYANISLIDQQVGWLIALLKEKRLYDNTLVVFTADHGEYMGFHHMTLKANHMYDPLAKVPLLVKWPGGRRAGTVSERLVSNIDLAPTLCRAAGLCPDAGMHGEDLGADGPNRRIVFCEQGPPVMARTRESKLLVMGGPPEKDLFFDLRRDPLEMHNLAGTPQVQDEIKRLRAAIAAWRPKPLQPHYVDLSAPQIRGPNVPPPGLDHRQAVIEYFEAKMREGNGR
jgi:arylsulfatase A-like enzyme